MYENLALLAGFVFLIGHGLSANPLVAVLAARLRRAAGGGDDAGARES